MSAALFFRLTQHIGRGHLPSETTIDEDQLDVVQSDSESDSGPIFVKNELPDVEEKVTDDYTKILINEIDKLCL